FSPCGSGAGPILSNRWVHLAAVYDGGMLSYYVDGSSAGSTGCSLGSGTWNDLRIGGYYSGDGSDARGLIDEVRLYSTARTAGDVRSDASVLSLHFDEDGAYGGASAYDASGLEHHARITGAVYLPGLSGSALSFSAPSDRAVIASAPLF